MRFAVAFALSVTALLLPALAVSDPVQNPSAANAPSAGSTALAPGATQAPTVPQAAASATTDAHAAPETVVVHGDRVDLDQVVCKDAPPSIGSRIGGGRECLTQREWNRRMRESQDTTRRQQVLGFHN